MDRDNSPTFRPPSPSSLHTCDLSSRVGRIRRRLSSHPDAPSPHDVYPNKTHHPLRNHSQADDDAHAEDVHAYANADEVEFRNGFLSISGPPIQRRSRRTKGGRGVSFREDSVAMGTESSLDRIVIRRQRNRVGRIHRTPSYGHRFSPSSRSGRSSLLVEIASGIQFDRSSGERVVHAGSQITPETKGMRVVPHGQSGLGKSTISTHKNDYSQHFVDSGDRPQNYILETRGSDPLEGHPRIRTLTEAKDALVESRSTPPMSLRCDLKSFDLQALGTEFDVIVIDPPWAEYARRFPGLVNSYWTVEELSKLRIRDVAASVCFLFLWCGSSEGLEHGRRLFREWGFRRSEDICWVKTLPEHRSKTSCGCEDGFLVRHTTEHCLFGISGTVRRAVDSHLIHCNLDVDVILDDEPEFGSLRKPEALYRIAERFSLGRRRLELFGEDHNVRRGWVTLGSTISVSTFDPRLYLKALSDTAPAADDPYAPSMERSHYNPFLLGSTDTIEELRPRSPDRKKNLERSGSSNDFQKIDGS